ncbi:hypothetical protein F5X99DRAFT_410309 [Biscogniauxia marginata]|nr:hypothetical protein F5X99DRAFT_410309 [Biscogniauxia marginata]
MQKALFPPWLMVLGGACLVPVLPIYVAGKLGYRAFGATRSAVQRAKIRRRVAHRRLPKSQPLVSALEGPQHAAPPSKGASFVHLPLEIRQHIYRLVLGDPAVVQVGPLFPTWGRRPQTWSGSQHIRGEEDPPSVDLCHIVHLGAPGSKPRIKQSEDDHVLLCGERHACDRRCRDPQVSFTNLMRSCRVVYGDMLGLLYSDNTISLLGVDMVHYFLRNASPEGLNRIRYVHVVLIVSSKDWEAPKKKGAVVGAVRALRESLPGLCQLEVEVTLTWGQPRSPKRFGEWLRDHVFGQLRGLDEFVLKIMIYIRKDSRRYGGTRGLPTRWEPLISWDQTEYRALKAKITTPDLREKVRENNRFRPSTNEDGILG